MLADSIEHERPSVSTNVVLLSENDQLRAELASVKNQIALLNELDRLHWGTVDRYESEIKQLRLNLDDLRLVHTNLHNVIGAYDSHVVTCINHIENRDTKLSGELRQALIGIRESVQFKKVIDVKAVSNV